MTQSFNKNIGRYVFTENFSSEDENLINELANELSFNYLANSFGDDPLNLTDYSEIIKKHKIEGCKYKTLGEEFNNRKVERRRCRNILIVGAGASYDSFSGIPLGQQMVTSFEEVFVKKIKSIPFLEEKFDLEKREIEKLLKGNFDFENFLALLSKFFVTQKSLREEIKKHTGFRFSPSLFYEIVAHMLKHTFLDVVINFNFDEILDQCIEDELGEQNYHFVLSDGHTIKIEDILVNGRIKSPVYLKPHGTFSHKSSLRFTKRHYLDVPDDVKSMLGGLLSGYRGEGKEVERINLICVGFDLASIEFNEILNEHLSPDSRIYHFYYCPPNDEAIEKHKRDMKDKFDGQLKNFQKNAGEKKGLNFDDIYRPFNIALFIEQKGENQNNLTSPLSEIFSVLWRQTYVKFNEYNRPRSIGRHEVINYLFYDKYLFNSSIKSTDNPIESQRGYRDLMKEYFEESPKYFRDRVLIEVGLELLRNNGNVDIVEILKGRIGTYYEKYSNACKVYKNKIREVQSLYEFLSEYSHDGRSGNSLANMNEFPETKLTFRILPFKLEYILEKVLGDIKIKFENDIINNFREPFKKHYVSQEKETIVKLNKFRNALEKLIRDNYNENPLAITILTNFLRSNLLSSKIRENILVNYEKEVVNGLIWKNPKGKRIRNSYLFEFFRLFSKTNASSYFNIRAKKKDSRYRIWESFQLKNVLHTNLLLSSDFKHQFLNKNWDCLLTVFEAGETIKKIIKENINKEGFLEKMSKKSIVLLCCYEAVEQLHLLKDEKFQKDNSESSFYKDQFDAFGNIISLKRTDEQLKVNKYKIEVLVELHKEYLLEDIKNAEIKQAIADGMNIVFVPFWEHNKHSSIFLKSVPEGNEIFENSKEGLMLITSPEKIEINNKKIEHKKFQFLYEGGYYMYRKGFSNNLNPVKLGFKDLGIKENYLERDIDKLLLFFYNVLCRGIMFQVQNASDMRYNTSFIVKELNYHRSWTPEEYFQRMQIFVGNLYEFVRKRQESKI